MGKTTAYTLLCGKVMNQRFDDTPAGKMRFAGSVLSHGILAEWCEIILYNIPQLVLYITEWCG